MVRIVKNIYPQEDSVMQWHTQAGKINTNIKVIVDFTLPALRKNNVMTWKCHMNDFTKGSYDMTLGRYLLT